jgi:hypothetical protein
MEEYMKLFDFLRKFKGETRIEIYDYLTKKNLYIGYIDDLYTDEFKLECFPQYATLLDRKFSNEVTMAHNRLWIEVYQ